MLQHTKRQVKYTMRNLIVMFVTAVCFLFLLKLKWPKNKEFYELNEIFRGNSIGISDCRVSSCLKTLPAYRAFTHNVFHYTFT